MVTKTFLKGLFLASFLLTSSNMLIRPAKAERVNNFQNGENFDIALPVANYGYYTLDLSSHFGADADLFLYDANNALVASSREFGSDTLSGNLNPGNYRIRINMSACMFDNCSADIVVRREGRKVILW